MLNSEEFLRQAQELAESNDNLLKLADEIIIEIDLFRVAITKRKLSTGGDRAFLDACDAGQAIRMAKEELAK